MQGTDILAPGNCSEFLTSALRPLVRKRRVVLPTIDLFHQIPEQFVADDAAARRLDLGVGSLAHFERSAVSRPVQLS